MKLDIPYPPQKSQEAAKREALRQFARRQLSTILAGPIAAAVLAGCLYRQLPDTLLMPWLVSNLVLSMVCMALATVLLRELDNPAKLRRVVFALPLAMFGKGLVWGLAPLLLVVPAEPGYTVLCMAVLCVEVALSLHALCLHYPSLWSFVLPGLLPAGTYLSLRGSGLTQLVGLCCLAMLSVCAYYGLGASHFGRRSVSASVQNKLLSTKLKATMAELRTLQRTTRESSTRDPLTQCHNRRAMVEYLEREMVTQDREGRTLGVLLIDADHFKRINDVYGHLTGDEVLKALTKRIQTSLRGNDFLARYGGAEFVALIHAANPAELAQAAERVRFSIAASPLLEQPELVRITVCVGATLREPKETINVVFARADQAVYRAKTGGRNQVELDLPVSFLFQNTPTHSYADIDITDFGDLPL